MLMDISTSGGKLLAWIGLALLIVHAVFGAVFTIQAVQSGKKSEKWYLKQNSRFWTRRFSGIAILILVFFHFGVYGETVNGTYELKEFTTFKFVTQILLIFALFVNIRPLLISLGLLQYKERKEDIFVVISVLLLFFTGAVLFYYIRWQFL
ncbi:hypothetical protein CKR_0690 [Clostridium kluyveri NBRC 12016]|uniref:Pilus assembly protein PilX n=3 Tax=Clostridium kluyveri TaxID=1534 RepID=A5N690_CLOK5|nr:hypothetical protein [Clostridium kluyveri]EDK32821.1 Hypothetical protein CKL_0768 [Clostridium kluyveri DSM 555]BAH05741.1 hypothetical protein CKR_0690 [Clostridium kluyveri NBRC 12016]